MGATEGLPKRGVSLGLLRRLKNRSGRWCNMDICGARHKGALTASASRGRDSRQFSRALSKAPNLDQDQADLITYRVLKMMLEDNSGAARFTKVVEKAS